MTKTATLIIALTALVMACKGEDKSASKAEPAPKQVEQAAAATAKPAEPPAAAKEPAKAADEPPRPPSITNAHVATADQLVGAVEELGKAVGAAGTDCKAAVVALNAHGPKLKTAAQNLASGTDGDDVAQLWLKEYYMPRMLQAIAPMQATLDACKGDKELLAATRGLPLPRKIAKP
jgi:hypothetical protein